MDEIGEYSLEIKDINFSIENFLESTSIMEEKFLIILKILLQKLEKI